MGRRVAVPFPPQRVVSLVPSQTELLFDLGLGAKVVGVTKFCIHPAGARTAATVIGGTKNFDFEKIAALEPDLIIGNKEENYQAYLRTLLDTYNLISQSAEAEAARNIRSQAKYLALNKLAKKYKNLKNIKKI